MVTSIILLLIFFSLSESAIFDSAVSASENEPTGFKFTRLVNINMGNGDDTWTSDLKKFIQTQVNDMGIGRKAEHVEIPLKISFTIDQNHIQDDKCEKNDFGLEELFKGCKSLVGVSRERICNIKSKSKSNGQILFPRSCREIFEKGNNHSGIYEIQPRTSNKPFAVLCDMETKGGGWTHIQRRFDGSEDFYRKWRDYKFGFGTLEGEFWIGLEHIYQITGYESSELLIEITDRDKKKAYAHYAYFAIGPENDGYVLSSLAGFTGDAGDSLTHHKGAKFTTIDLDQDNNNNANCANICQGAWWFTSCHMSNLNGNIMNQPLSEANKWHGMSWATFKENNYVHAGSRMMVRPTGS